MSLGLALALPTRPRGDLLAAAIRALFASSNGAWYERRDLSSMYQDSAGTTAAALNSPVGLANDKSGLGNEAIQATSTARPSLSARVNMLWSTSQLQTWIRQSSTAGPEYVPVVTDNYAAAPDGSLTASRIQLTPPGDNQWSIVGLNVPVSLAASQPFVQAVDFKASAGQAGKKVNVYAYNNSATAYGVIGTVTLTDEWQRFYLPQAFEGTCTTYCEFRIGKARGSFVGQGAATRGALDSEISTDFLVCFPQLNLGATATRYQRVTTATDYDTAGFPRKVKYEAVDDKLTTTFASSLGSTCTVARAIPGTGASILTAQTIGTTFDDATDNCALIIIDRALTAAETVNVTAYLNAVAGV